jgi:MarR family transcriptional regulator, transcriptional regulator for hemolysin
MSRNPAVRREILFQLNDVARAMRTYIDQCARRHGMTRAQWGVLLRLEREEGMMQAELAESLEIQPISLARLIDRLCDQKLVERRPHPRDRRANRLYLTAKGRATLARLVPLGRRISGDVLATFTDAEAGELLKQLLRIKGNIRKSSAANGAGARQASPSRNGNGARHAG